MFRRTDLAAKIRPQDPFYYHQRLFSERDFGLYDEKGNYEDQRKKIEQSRREALVEIFSAGGIEKILDFVDKVESPWRVGFNAGECLPQEVDGRILPGLLDRAERPEIQFCGGFVLGRFNNLGWSWVDGIDISNWRPDQVGQLFAYLPFTTETWSRVAKKLGKDEVQYWTRTNVNPYAADGNLEQAIEKLLEHDRPSETLSCYGRMIHNKESFDIKRAVRALLSIIKVHHGKGSLDTHAIKEVIEALQSNPKVDPDDLFRVEWAFLPLLDPHFGGAPKFLERKMANEPEFFCEVIRSVYRSRKSEEKKEPTEAEQRLASNAYRLLRSWRIVPGRDEKNGFDSIFFKNWLVEVKKIAEESGHLDVTLITVGEVLLYSPPDPGGLWMHKAVAEELNSRDAEKMRHGYHTSAVNARGVHWVDPEGKPEMALAKVYNEKADKVEAEGFQRFAVTLRGIASGYEREAERLRSRGLNEDN